MWLRILCGDCGAESDVRFHVVGLKCGSASCGGYNTRKIGVAKDPHPPEAAAASGGGAAGGGGGGGAADASLDAAMAQVTGLLGPAAAAMAGELLRVSLPARVGRLLASVPTAVATPSRRRTQRSPTWPAATPRSSSSCSSASLQLLVLGRAMGMMMRGAMGMMMRRRAMMRRAMRTRKQHRVAHLKSCWKQQQ